MYICIDRVLMREEDNNKVNCNWDFCVGGCAAQNDKIIRTNKQMLFRTCARRLLGFEDPWHKFSQVRYVCKRLDRFNYYI